MKGNSDGLYMMSKGKLKTAVLGLDDKGLLLLEAASQTDYFHLQAVADKDASLAERIAQRYNCLPYNDYRQLIIQNQLDCLIVTAGLYCCDEYIRTAMKKKFHILKLAPPARNFEEAAEFVRLAESKNIQFAIANPSRFAQSFLALRRFLDQNQDKQIFLITASCNLGEQNQPNWHTDPKLAGGGVLLRNCYEIIDQIIWNFDTPQQLYSVNINLAADRQQRLYLTEDTAVVTMKFTENLCANLIASRSFGPSRQFLKLYTKDNILTVSKTQLVISDNNGQIIEQSEYDDDELILVKKLLKNFALSILSPDKNKLCSSARENLKDMAVIESAYLSARTGFPEEPGRILQMTQIEPTDIQTPNK
ncbi:MAG: Gfo/Idh/MocA family protein [Planctomycetota bacterium]